MKLTKTSGLSLGNQLILPAILAALAGAPPAWSSPQDDCPARYQDSYADSWRLTRESWNASCADQFKPEDILAKTQQTFISACRERFKSIVEQKRTVDATIWGYCAQGRPGESRLETMFDLPPVPAPAAAPAAQPASPAPAKKGRAAGRFYDLVRTKGHRYRGTPIDGYLYGNGIFVGEYHDKAVPPYCKLEFLAYCDGLDKDKKCHTVRPGRITDKGCTGRVEDMDIEWDGGATMSCGEKPAQWEQAQVDAVFDFAIATVEIGCGK
ncbi:MAG: hypothetical protein NTY77_19330 [Elusimicrobia bacterium]|nr:hypothetical protein [Elusimicrobiota bacterium]